jgi:hypothetical protein
MAWLTEVLAKIADHKVSKLYELFPQNLELPEKKQVEISAGYAGV